VHCHAGLGRTGFVICSYLVHEYRMSAHESIHYMRAKRQGSVQMTKQIQGIE
jgi:protein-tyrosine phosphatase